MIMQMKVSRCWYNIYTYITYSVRPAITQFLTQFLCHIMFYRWQRHRVCCRKFW